MDLKYRKKQIAALGVMAILAGLFLFVWLRPPVVIVTDRAYLALYGQKRAETKQRLLTLRLWRRVRFAPVADDAGVEAAAFAVGALSAAPALVIFPESFSDGAELYAAELKTKGRTGKTNVFLSRSRGGDGEWHGEGIALLETDRLTDLYRAALCAAVIAKGGEGDVVVWARRIRLRTGAMSLLPVYKRAATRKALSSGVCLTP
jgi:hypothetical protein